MVSKIFFSRKKFHKSFIVTIPLITILIWSLKINLNGFYNEDNENEYDFSNFSIEINPKPWYLENGTRYPKLASISKVTGRHNAVLLPLERSQDDRVLNQLMFVPPNYDPTKIKTILVNNGYPYWFGLKSSAQAEINFRPSWWKQKRVDDIFEEFKCPVDACRVTDDKAERKSADLVFFLDYYEHTNETRPADQLYAIHYMEPPYKIKPLKYPDVFNWTITYRHDSTIVTPYAKWVYYDSRVKQMKQSKNFAANKTKKVAWFVSNCQHGNNRAVYVQELSKYIQVDIYGDCGTMRCPRSDEEKCFHILNNDYKFYLAFENVNCKDYVTEKFFNTGLGHDVIPIVMGGTPEYYEENGPLRSYIHVDHFKSPTELAEYLHVLDKNDELYNSYFEWRGTGEVIPNWAYFWCRICALLHDDQTISTKHWYKDINEWWRGPGICEETTANQQHH